MERPQSGLLFRRHRAAAITAIFLAPGVRNRHAGRSHPWMSQATPQELGRFRPRLLSFALRRLGNRDQAEDVVQETLLAALEGFERFGSTSSLGTWLTGILKHKIVDAMRASSREEPLDYDEDVSHDNGPEEGLARRRLADAVGAGLRQLPSCAAQVFVMREVMGMDTAEVCSQLAITSSNCWVMHYRACRKLRACPGIRDAF